MGTHPPVYQTQGPKYTFVLPEGIKIADQVVITFCDCCAAGPRFLHALQQQGSVTIQRTPFSITGRDSSKAAVCSPSDVATSSPQYVLNVVSQGQAQPTATFICLNSAVSGQEPAHMAVALANWLQSLYDANPSRPPTLIAAAAVLKGVKHDGTHALPINAALPAGLPVTALPPATQIQDPYLAAIMHVLHVSGLPAVCLLTPGYKPSVQSGLQDSIDTVMQLAGTLSAAGLLGGAVCPQEAVAQLQLLHRWYADVQPGGGEIMYL